LDYPTLEIVPVQDCPDCRRFSKAGLQMYMLGHLATHVRNKVKYFPCEVCGLKFESSAYLEKHENKKHRNAKCGDCSKKFKSVLLLQKHIEDVHKTEKCSECDFRTANISVLEKHVYFKHPKDICEECGMAFEDEYTVEKHFKEIHEKSKCDDCDVEFDTDESLDEHKVKVHKHSKTTFKEFGGGLMMMMISETPVSAEEQQEVIETKCIDLMEGQNDCNEPREELNSPRVKSPVEKEVLDVVPMDVTVNSEAAEVKEKKSFDEVKQMENKNFNIFGAGFFMMYKEDSENNLGQVFEKNLVNKEKVSNTSRSSDSLEEASDTCHEIGKDLAASKDQIVTDTSFTDTNSVNACVNNVKDINSQEE